MKIDVGSAQTLGRRNVQEDAYIVVQREEVIEADTGYSDSGKLPIHLAVACDGMGGEGNGQQCSEKATKAFAECFLSLQSLGKAWGSRLLMSLYAANSAITEFKIQNDIMDSGSGCTLSAVLIVGTEEPELFYLQVGDSPIFRFHCDTRLERMDPIGPDKSTCLEYSTPHTYLCMDLLPAVDDGEMTMEQALLTPKGHALVSVLTGAAIPFVTFGPHNRNGNPGMDHKGIRLQPGDFVVLCTDGVTSCGEMRKDVRDFLNEHDEVREKMHFHADAVTRNTIAECLLNHSAEQRARQAAKEIIEEVDARGLLKQDNASCIVFKITQ